MLPTLLSRFSNDDTVKNVLSQLGSGKSINIDGLAGSAKIFLTVTLFNSTDKDILCILPTDNESKVFYQDIKGILPDKCILFFPAHYKSLWNELGASSQTVGQKIECLKKVNFNEPKIIITTVLGLNEKIAGLDHINKNHKIIKPGQNINFEGFITDMVNMGFMREERIDRTGEISVRGGIIDIFPFECVHPIRLEFWGDEVESIREFDIQSQRSLKNLQEIDLIPPGVSGLFGLYEEKPLDMPLLDSTLFDLLNKDSIVFQTNTELNKKIFFESQNELLERIEHFKVDHGFSELDYYDFYAPVDLFELHQDSHCYINLKSFNSTNNKIDFPMQTCPHFDGKLNSFKSEIYKIVENPHKKIEPLIGFFCDSQTQEHRLHELFEEEGFPEIIKTLPINLAEGFSWPQQNIHIYTNRELYSRVRIPKVQDIEKRNVSLRELSTIHKGDYVVHDDYGVGVFRGLERITAYGKERDCLVLEYQDKDKLFVPLEKMDRVQKFSSKDGVVPAVSKLGSPQWEKLKKKTKQRVKDVAEKLIKLYAARQTKKGYTFNSDTIWQRELEASFEYDETPDQIRTIDEIKKDMESSHPMDRLVCGDVGFGKTEVAIRAAFKAINDGKQVAVLVPTTILAHQHFETFAERFQPYPVRVEMLSRFKSAKQQKEIVPDIKTGKVDLVIGTHRLLSKDIEFKDIGLLIIDEEHRFGVMHKEKLKMLKETVDTLSLSATPIPRTLHLSLIGSKDMSIINTPPQNRLPVKTEVCKYDPETIREVIMQEVDRGGQVFFVHNRVKSIYTIANQIRELVPEVSVAVGHGQMTAAELEKVMLAFEHKKVQVLVSTMIIESGIDIPSANTLIVNRADTFGIAQLYQLRGRVGRSDQQAFAYLLIPSLKSLTSDALKRLQTLQEMSDLGSGYKVAMRDLEIRGTGNIFGAEQSGFAQALGFDVYTKVMDEAISELKKEMNVHIDVEEDEDNFEPNVDMKQDAFLPQEYVRSAPERIDLYRRLVDIHNEAKVDDLKEELKDRFGPLPTEAENLIEYLKIKILARQLKIEKLVIEKKKITAKFSSEHMPVGEQFRPWLGKIISKMDENFNLKQEQDGLWFEITKTANESEIALAKKSLQKMI